jgi:hypothetical protein
MRQINPSPEIDGTLDGDDSDVDDEGRMSDARHQRIWASMRAHLDRWNRHFAAEVFADIEAVARERDDANARQILADIRLVRGAVALGDARLVAELAFRVAAGAQAADLMPDAQRYRSWKAANRQSSERYHGTAGERDAKVAFRVRAYQRALAQRPMGVTARAARTCGVSDRTIQRALKKIT